MMPFEIKGMSELLGDLAGMATALSDDGPATKRALKAGAEPIHRRMVQNASGDPKVISGTLRGSIKIGTIRKRNGRNSISVGVHQGDGAGYAQPVEFGHGGPTPAPPHPFVRPAYDGESDVAYDNMRRELRAAINRRA